MDYISCSDKIKNILDNTDGVKDFDTHISTGRITIYYSSMDPEKIIDTIEKSGFNVKNNISINYNKKYGRLIEVLKQ